MRHDPGVAAVVIAPRAQGHHHLLQRAIARPLPQTVDGAFHLARSRLHRRQTVGHSQSQVVMAVDADHGPVDAPHPAAQALDNAEHLLRRGIADGVGNIDCGRPGIDHGLDNAAEKRQVGAGGVLRRKFHISAEVAGAFDARHGPGGDLILAHPQFELAVDRTRRQKYVDAGPLRHAQCLPRPVDVGVVAAGQPADDRPADAGGNLADTGKVARRGDRKSRFNHIHAELHQRLRHLHFFGEVHARAWRLFAIAQRGVENADRAEALHGRLPGRPVTQVTGHVERRSGRANG